MVKIPRWPFDKFPTGDRTVTTQMKATGEVMAIDRSFEAALQKAVRSLEVGGRSLLWEESERRTGKMVWPRPIRGSGGLMSALRRERRLGVHLAAEHGNRPCGFFMLFRELRRWRDAC